MQTKDIVAVLFFVGTACVFMNCSTSRGCAKDMAGQIAEHTGVWQIRIPLCGGDFVELERSLEAQSRVDGVGAFANAIGTTLRPKLTRFRDVSYLTARV